MFVVFYFHDLTPNRSSCTFKCWFLSNLRNVARCISPERQKPYDRGGSNQQLALRINRRVKQTKQTSSVVQQLAAAAAGCELPTRGVAARVVARSPAPFLHSGFKRFLHVFFKLLRRAHIHMVTLYRPQPCWRGIQPHTRALSGQLEQNLFCRFSGSNPTAVEEVELCWLLLLMFSFFISRFLSLAFSIANVASVFFYDLCVEFCW